MTPSAACSLCVAAYPPGGNTSVLAKPLARCSEPRLFLAASLVNVGRMRGSTTGMLRVVAVANRRRAVSVSARGRLL